MKTLNRCRRWAWIALLAALPGLVEAQSTSPFQFPDELWVIQGVQVPVVSDTFTVLQVNTWPFRELGFTLKYQTPLTRRVSLDLYIYPVSDSLVEMSEADAMAAEFQNAVGQLRQYTTTNREGVEVTVDSEGPVEIETASGVVRSGWLAEGSFHRSDRVDPTLIYMFCWDGIFLKVRASYHPDEEEKLKPHLDAWLETTLARVQRAPTGGGTEPGQNR